MRAWTWVVAFGVVLFLATACGILSHLSDGSPNPTTSVQETPTEAPTGPHIADIDPPSGAPGIDVMVRGENFDDVLVIRWVKFGDKTATTVTWSDEEIVVKVPHGTGTLDVTVGPFPESNSVPFAYKKPRLDKVSPSSGEPGMEVTIEGAHFGVSEMSPSYHVKFGNSLATVESWNDKEIVAEAPSDYGTGLAGAKIMASLIEAAVTKDLTDAVLEALLPTLKTVQLKEGEPWWESLGKIMLALGIPGVEVAPEGTMDVALAVKTPTGKSEAVLFTYKLPEAEAVHIEPPLEIAGVDPTQPEALPTRQWLTILGSGFVPDSQVVFRVDDNEYPIPPDRVHFVSSTEMKVYVGLTNPGTWTAQVVNPGDHKSNSFDVEVVAAGSTPDPHLQASIEPSACDNSVPPIPMLAAARHAMAAGFEGEAAVTVLAIAWSESGGSPTACGENKGQDGITWSWDRGILQINNYWHPEVSDACAFDSPCSFQAAFEISSHGADFTPWTTYGTNAYQAFLQQGREAVTQVAGAEPEAIEARIDGYTPGSMTQVEVGQSVTLSVTFTNTGSTAWQFIAGASVWDVNGSLMADYEKTLSTALQPSQQTIINWSHLVNTTGDYWVQFGVWKTIPYVAENLLDKKPSPSQKLIVGQTAAKFWVGSRVRTTANLNVRTGPGTGYPEIADPSYSRYAPTGNTGTVLDGPISADGYVWWQVEYDVGYTGWCVGDWLENP